MKITPNLIFGRNAREAFQTYERIFGADRLVLITFGDMPDSPLSPEWNDKIAHAWLEIGDQALMGADGPPDALAQGSASGSVALHFDTVDEARRIFDALADGGAALMPFAVTSWSPGFGMVNDRFGKEWLINTRQENG